MMRKVIDQFFIQTNQVAMPLADLRIQRENIDQESISADQMKYGVKYNLIIPG